MYRFPRYVASLDMTIAGISMVHCRKLFCPKLAPFSPFFKSKWVPSYQREPILIFNPALSNYPENDTPHLIAVWQTANLVILPMPQS